jgi:hypothetical protein
MKKYVEFSQQSTSLFSIKRYIVQLVQHTRHGLFKGCVVGSDLSDHLIPFGGFSS